MQRLQGFDALFLRGKAPARALIALNCSIVLNNILQKLVLEERAFFGINTEHTSATLKVIQVYVFQASSIPCSIYIRLQCQSS